MISHAVDFDALIVVDVEVALLCCSKHRVILQEAYVIDFLLGLEFHDKILTFPVKHRKMTLFSTKKHMLSVLGY